MTSLHWQDTGSKAAPASHSNLWFSIALGLLGIIVGFGVGSWQRNGTSLAENQQPQVAQAPSVPTPTAPTPQAPAPAGPLAPIDPKTDRIRGDLSKATVAVIEYSDFECPFCKRHFSTMQQVVSTYGVKVAFVYRDFPLSFHQNAHKEAEAGRCVFEQGGNAAFWKYHDYVFDKTTSNGTGFAIDQLPVAAKQAGVDSAKFQTCLDSGKYAKLVDEEETAGQTAGVTGTPGSFVVNLKTQQSQMISGAMPFASFKTAIDAAL